MTPQHASCFIYHLRLRSCSETAANRDRLRPIFLVRAGQAWGEAGPTPHLRETVHETGEELKRLLVALEQRPNGDPATVSAWLREESPMFPAARTALEMLAYDTAARQRAQPLHAYLRLPSPAGAITAYTFALSTEAEIEQRLEEAREFSVLNVKCGGPAETDLRLLKWLARQTDKPLRIDANGNWTLLETQGMLAQLGRLNVEYLEQPLAAHLLEELVTLGRTCPVPILLDAYGACSLEQAVKACNGIALRLMTCGGITPLLRLIRRAHELGLRVALNNTAESSAATTAAAHLAGAVEYVNLSAHLLTDNDPLAGLDLAQGQIALPAAPGLGLAIRQEYRDSFRKPVAPF